MMYVARQPFHSNSLFLPSNSVWGEYLLFYSTIANSLTVLQEFGCITMKGHAIIGFNHGLLGLAENPALGPGFSVQKPVPRAGFSAKSSKPWLKPISKSKLHITGAVRGIHQWSLYYHHIGTVMRKSFHIMTSSCKQLCLVKFPINLDFLSSENHILKCHWLRPHLSLNGMLNS